MKLFFDTEPFVVFFKKESEHEKIETILRDIENTADAFVSTITLTELFYIFSRYTNQDFAKTILDYIRTSNFIIIPVTDDIAELAGELKFKYSGKDPKKGMPLADCIIAATALKTDSVLFTDDNHFKKIKGLKVQWV